MSERMNRTADYERLHELLSKALDDGDAEATAELEEALAASEETRELYVEYMHETSCLRTAAARDARSREDEFVGEVSNSNRRFPRGVAYLMTLAASGLLVAVIGSTHWDAGGGGAATAEFTATVTRATDVVWADASSGSLKPLSRVAVGQEIEVESGQLEIVFDSGVELLLTGPASLRVENRSGVVARRGRYWARVGEAGRGFTIDTPASTVTDLGTEFGVSVLGDDATTVAVFDGEVDVTPTEREGRAAGVGPIRLVQGEAIGISSNGDCRRVVSVQSDEFPTVAARPGAAHADQGIIREVFDNLSGRETRKYYRIVRAGFSEDALAFVDRGHEWNGVDVEGLPTFLLGGDYVMPFNDDKFLGDMQVTVRLGSACMLYVLFDKNMPTPAWLSELFIDTGAEVGLDHGPGPFTRGAVTAVGAGQGIDDRFSVWRRRIEAPCEVALGGAHEPEDKELGWNMFGVVASPLPIEVTAL